MLHHFSLLEGWNHILNAFMYFLSNFLSIELLIIQEYIEQIDLLIQLKKIGLDAHTFDVFSHFYLFCHKFCALIVCSYIWLILAYFCTYMFHFWVCCPEMDTVSIQQWSLVSSNHPFFFSYLGMSGETVFQRKTKKIIGKVYPTTWYQKSRKWVLYIPLESQFNSEQIDV